MAASSGSREADSGKRRQKRPWEDVTMSGQTGVAPGLPENLGFYDLDAVRRERRRDPGKTSLSRVRRVSPG